MAVKDLSAKRCLITGAASGIGRATAIAAAAKGAQLFLTDINEQGLRSVASEIADGRRAAVMSLGRTDEEAEKRLGSALIAGDSIISIDSRRRPPGSSAARTITVTPLTEGDISV